jgi:DtxR family Mn-dependent transcriptional regulator
MSKQDKSLTGTMEDYLEAIALLKKQESVPRVRDIGRLLGVKGSSVNVAIKTLSQKGLVMHEKYGYVDLTPAGEDVARKVQDKHDILLAFLTKVLNISETEAAQDACKMEHAISYKTFNRMTKFMQFVETGIDNGKPQWLKSFKHYLKTGKKLTCRARNLSSMKK